MSSISVIAAYWNIFSIHRGQTRWVFSTDDEPDSSQLTDAADAVATAFGANKAWLSSSSALVGTSGQVVEFVPYTTPGGYVTHRFHPTTIEYFGAPVAINGTGSASGSSPQVTYGLTLRTSLPGKSYRGRMYLPGVPEDKVDAGGTLDSTAAGQAKTFAEAAATGIEGALTGLSPSWVVPAFKLATVTAVFDTVARTRAHTQRRRLRATTI